MDKTFRLEISDNIRKTTFWCCYVKRLYKFYDINDHSLANTLQRQCLFTQAKQYPTCQENSLTVLPALCISAAAAGVRLFVQQTGCNAARLIDDHITPDAILHTKHDLFLKYSCICIHYVKFEYAYILIIMH